MQMPIAVRDFTKACRYTFAGKYDKTLGLYLRLGRGPVFELIEKHDLYSAVKTSAINVGETVVHKYECTGVALLST